MKILRCLGFLSNVLSKSFIHDVLGDVILRMIWSPFP